VKMKRPFFSVVMPVYNMARFLPEVLADLRRQTWEDFEVVAVDDGSTDGSREILQGWEDGRLRVILRAENGGLVAALNEGLAAARGVWVARQDADDRCDRRRLERQAELIRRAPDGVLFFSRARLLNERGWWRGSLRPPVEDAELRWDLGFRNAVPHTSAVFPLGLVRDELGGYGGDNVTADFDLWSRLLRRGKAYGAREALIGYRVHGHSIMGRANEGQAGAGAREEATREALGEVLQGNLREWSGASEEEADLLAGAWLEPEGVEDWEKYFAVRDRLAAGQRVSGELLAEQDYTLWHRCVGVSQTCGDVFWWAWRRRRSGAWRDWPWWRWGLSRVARVLAQSCSRR
jgi:hypothetical protein